MGGTCEWIPLRPKTAAQSIATAMESCVSHRMMIGFEGVADIVLSGASAIAPEPSLCVQIRMRGDL